MDNQPIRPTLPARVSHPAQTLVRPAPASKPEAARKALSKPVSSSTPVTDKALRFRPVVRAPMAVLEILDDGRDEGECIRIRLDALTIGRTTGDVVIPHDGQLSASHARISRRIIGGVYRWYLTDLGSTNGTFVRAAKAKISDGRLLILGSFRYRLQSARGSQPVAEQSDGTRGWRTVSSIDAALAPSLVRLKPDGTEQAFPLIGDLVTLGQSAADCSIVISDDPALSSLHARVRPLDTGQFQIEDAGSLNGIWFGIQEHPIESTVEFQLGEQRFRLRVSP